MTEYHKQGLKLVLAGLTIAAVLPLILVLLSRLRAGECT